MTEMEAKVKAIIVDKGTVIITIKNVFFTACKKNWFLRTYS